MADEKKYYLELTEDELAIVHGAVLGPALALAPEATAQERKLLALSLMLRTRLIGQKGMITLLDKIAALANLKGETPNVQGTAGLH